MGSGIASDPAALRKAAENMYITNVDINDAMTTDFIAAAIRPIGSTVAGTPTEGYSGQALKDYQAIQGIAKANGFRVKDNMCQRMSSKDIIAFTRRAKKAAKTRMRRKPSSLTKRMRDRSLLVRSKNAARVNRISAPPASQQKTT
jgi:hypothetical protein